MTLHGRDLAPMERARALLAIRRMVERGALSLGDAVRVLRAGFLRMSRAEFSKLTGVSVPALAQIESNTGNPTVDTLNRLVGMFGMQVGLVGRPGHGAPASPIELTEAEFEVFSIDARAVLARNRRKPKR